MARANHQPGCRCPTVNSSTALLSDCVPIDRSILLGFSRGRLLSNVGQLGHLGPLWPAGQDQRLVRLDVTTLLQYQHIARQIIVQASSSNCEWLSSQNGTSGIRLDLLIVSFLRPRYRVNSGMQSIELPENPGSVGR